jgi:outer membrane protein TolC
LPAPRGVVPAGLPVELLTRRPDLVMAERRLAAAGARVSEARAALFPRIALTGSSGRASEEIEDLLDSAFGVWSIAGNLAQPIFQGGALRAAVDLASAEQVEAAAAYAGAALQSYKEVETLLAAESLLSEREKHLAAAAEQSRAALALATQRYTTGLESYVTLLASQRNLLTAESEHIAVRRARLDARVDLYLALGGGFDASALLDSYARGGAPAVDTPVEGSAGGRS